MDPRPLFHAVNLTDGLLVAGACAHWLPASACLGALALTQGALAAACLCPRCALVGPTLTRVATDQRHVALTFDDGPDPMLTPWVLQTLARFDARASFFCVGARARACADTVRETAAAGHSIENHSDRHNGRFALLSTREIAREVDTAQETLTHLAGRAPRFFRAPMGFRNPWLAPVLAERGLTHCAWSRRGFDTRATQPDAVCARLTRGVRPGAILLLHDGHNARDAAGRPLMHTVLPALLATLKHQGLQAVDLPTLLAHARGTP